MAWRGSELENTSEKLGWHNPNRSLASSRPGRAGLE